MKKILKKIYWDFWMPMYFYSMNILNRKVLVNRTYKRFLHYPMNWKNPIDINEKINWMKIYSDTSEWTKLADKYRVREYVEKCGLSDILVPLYGKWKKPSEIDFASLPNSFVLKLNNGSGDCVIVQDKRTFNFGDVIKRYSKCLNKSYGLETGEFHYMKIPPLIISEQLLHQDGTISSSLIDYKVWCFDGKPYMIWVCFNRTKGKVSVDSYDLNWNYHPEWSIFTKHYQNGNGIIPKPPCLDYMLAAASTLSQGFPQVRVDFYVVEGKLYFGEMTFTSNCGCMNFYTKEFLIELGNQIKLP